MNPPRAPRTISADQNTKEAGPPANSDPRVLQALVAAANSAASIPAGKDYAIWENACRQLASGQPAPLDPVAAEPKTVIVVDDSAALRTTMQQALVSAGYRVLPAADGAAALAIARRHEAHLVIADVAKTGTKGIALIAQLREIPALRSTPVMMLTTDAPDSVKIAGRRAGANGWIAKPFDSQTLISIVRQICP